MIKHIIDLWYQMIAANMPLLHRTLDFYTFLGLQMPTIEFLNLNILMMNVELQYN